MQDVLVTILSTDGCVTDGYQVLMEDSKLDMMQWSQPMGPYRVGCNSQQQSRQGIEASQCKVAVGTSSCLINRAIAVILWVSCMYTGV